MMNEKGRGHACFGDRPEDSPQPAEAPVARVLPHAPAEVPLRPQPLLDRHRKGSLQLGRLRLGHRPVAAVRASLAILVPGCRGLGLLAVDRRHPHLVRVVLDAPGRQLVHPLKSASTQP
eukprot:scaffold433412_cov22-Prasinocladus_malaysianus.AAC.1